MSYCVNCGVELEASLKRYSDEMRIDTTVGVGTTVTMKIRI